MPKDPAKMLCISSNAKPPFNNECRISGFPPYSSGCPGIQCICHQTLLVAAFGWMPFVAIPLVTNNTTHINNISSSCCIFFVNFLLLLLVLAIIYYF